MKKAQKEGAVSPVIGVMLMLVVTIVIAALVSSFASGITTSQDRAPVVTLDVKISAAEGGMSKYVQIEHLGGETLKLGEVRIVTSYTIPEKYVDSKTTHAFKTIRHTIDGSIKNPDQNGFLKNKDGAPFIHQVHTVKTNEFMLTEGSSLLSIGTKGARNFNEAEFAAGSTLSILKTTFLGFDSDDKISYGFNEGSVVHVTISDIPSNKIIFDKDVIATW